MEVEILWKFRLRNRNGTKFKFKYILKNIFKYPREEINRSQTGSKTKSYYCK